MTRTALILELGLPVMAGIPKGLADDGWRVVHCRDARLAGPVEQVREALDAAMAREAPTLVLASLLPGAATALRSLGDTTLDDWRAGAADPIRIAMSVLSVLGERMKPAGQGAIAFVAPSLSLAGGRGMVALTTALEGQRGLVKSVARQWGASGVTLNWIAAAPRALSAHFDAAELVSKGESIPVALGKPPESRVAIAGLAAWLTGPAGRGMTGTTLMMDGGEWMVP
jgi:NAD(P)-dependent dehydrogenase (short-subunit alcohol dehydrogenase family)